MRLVCMLIKVALILCLEYPLGVSEIDCIPKSDTLICVDPNYVGDCHLDAADDFMQGNQFSEVELVKWMNLSCEGYKSD